MISVIRWIRRAFLRTADGAEFDPDEEDIEEGDVRVIDGERMVMSFIGGGCNDWACCGEWVPEDE